MIAEIFQNKKKAKIMKLTTQILIALFAISVGTSAVEAQIKKGSTKHHVSEGKLKDKAKEQVTKGSTKHHVKDGKQKNPYQVAIDPIIEKSGLETKEEVISCLEGKKSKMNFMTKWSFNKYKKGKTLSTSDKNRILSEASSCSSTDKMIPEPPKNNTKKGYQNKGKTSKGQKKGKVG